MSVTHIQQSIENVTTYLAEHPEECRYTDSAATAVVEEGLRCRAEGPHGALLVSDMPKALGGGGQHHRQVGCRVPPWPAVMRP